MLHTPHATLNREGKRPGRVAGWAKMADPGSTPGLRLRILLPPGLHCRTWTRGVGEAGNREHGDLCKLYKEAGHGAVIGDRLGSPEKGLVSWGQGPCQFPWIFHLTAIRGVGVREGTGTLRLPGIYILG